MEAKKNKKKKKDVQIADNNLLVQDLKRDDWVKNPVAYAQIRGDFTLMESNLMVNLVGALQDRINGYLKRKQMGVEQTDSLFTEEELNKGEIKIEIPLTDLEIRPDAYDEFDRTCEKMISVAATYEKTDEETGEQSIVHANIFSKIELPKSGEKADKSSCLPTMWTNFSTCDSAMLSTCDESYPSAENNAHHDSTSISRSTRMWDINWWITTS